MGWQGIAVLGAVIGVTGWRLHPFYRTSRVRGYVAVLIGVMAAVAAKVAGKETGLFYDGGVLEWPVCTAAALVAVGMAVALAARR
jgi:hypothetical protein